MTVTELKKYISENNKVPYILEKVGCHHIKYYPHKNYYTCGNPDGDNKCSVTVYNDEYLKCINYTRNIGDKADLITLIGFYKGYDFKETIKYLHNILGLPMTFARQIKKDETKDPLYIFKKIKKYKNKTNITDIEVLNEDLLKEYVPNLHISWFREGIMPWTAKKFNIGYSFDRRRIIIPHRYWATGELIGIVGRTTIENYNELGISKYLQIKPYSKGINLYGLWENYSSIQNAGYVVVYESEKSVLKRDSLGDGTGVALGCHVLTDEQVKILVGLNVEIIIAMDNDVSLKETKKMCDKFYGIRKVSYIYDRWNLLGEKDCVADMANKVYNFMFKYRNVYERE